MSSTSSMSMGWAPSWYTHIQLARHFYSRTLFTKMSAIAIPSTSSVMTLVVPPGVVGGQLIQALTPDGQTVAVTVPPGLHAGEPFHVQYALAQPSPFPAVMGRMLSALAPATPAMSVAHALTPVGGRQDSCDRWLPTRRTGGGCRPARRPDGQGHRAVRRAGASRAGRPPSSARRMRRGGRGDTTAVRKGI